MIARDLAEGAVDGAQVADEEFLEDAVDIGEVAADGGAGHADGGGEAGHGESGAAVSGHDGLCGVEDFVFAVEFAGGEIWAQPIDVVDAGAEVSG